MSKISKKLSELINGSFSHERHTSVKFCILNETGFDYIKQNFKMILAKKTNEQEDRIFIIEIGIKLKSPEKKEIEKIKSCFEEDDITLFDILQLSFNCYNSELFIYGCYSKMSRNMTQTPLIINKKLVCEKSVSDFKIQFQSHYGASDAVFISSGREDIDVRCFERPFLLKIVKPTKNLTNHSLSIELYPEIALKNLYLVRDMRETIFFNESKAEKIYTAKVYTKGDLLNIFGVFEIHQKTPIRVLHRRSNIVRKKIVNVTSIRSLYDNFYQVDLQTDAGAYVKEFIGGNFGRTNPSLSSLCGHHCDCVELDVIKVCHMELDPAKIVHKIELTNTPKEPGMI